MAEQPISDEDVSRDLLRSIGVLFGEAEVGNTEVEPQDYNPDFPDEVLLDVHAFGDYNPFDPPRTYRVRVERMD